MIAASVRRWARSPKRLADRIIVTDDNPRGEDGDAIVAEILAGVRAAAIRVRSSAIARAAIALAIARARAGDVVLIAGKGHEPYQEIAGVRRRSTTLGDRASTRWRRVP